jgi:hypothetical protein
VAVPVLIALVLIALGAVVLIYAPALHRFHIARIQGVGRPWNRLAAFSMKVSLKVAQSDPEAISIRVSGAILIVAGVALLVALLVVARRTP